MKHTSAAAAVVLLNALAAPLLAQPRLEPGAGSWRTWVLRSGAEISVPPPDAVATAGEIQWLKEQVAQRGEIALRQIRFWDSGPASWRWVEQMALRFERANIGTPRVVVAPWRNWAYLGVAMHDASVACWNAKYRYNRLRPSQVDPSLTTVIANPATPSYPSEHATIAGAASAVLAYFYPDEAEGFVRLAEEAARSRLLAGVDYPTDYFAGLALGRAVAARIIEDAKNDGSAAEWTGSVPQGPDYWTGTNPITPTAPNWKTWVLSTSSEFRPAPPPAYNSSQKQAELAEIKNFPRTFETNWRAMFYQTNEGVYTTWYRWATQKMFEYRMADNQPRAARAYALIGIALYDSLVASYEGKYTYWAIRPFQLDPQVATLFPTPNHPSYPANHGALSGAISEILAYLFPDDAQAFRDRAAENAESRIWAGIHYRSDSVAGLELGQKVGAKIIERARQDGSGQ